MKRMVSTGPEAMAHYQALFRNVMLKGKAEAPSLLDFVTTLALALDAKDHYTLGHSKAVSGYAAQIARQMGLPDPMIEEVRLGGILHDIGKIGVPEAVLNKPSHFTPEEFNLMKSHTFLGAKIVEPLRVKAIERLVRHHHERVDGTGYPGRLKGENIPLGARIVAVAESFDNMLSNLPYRRGRSMEEAVAELRRCSGTQFDSDIVEAFVRTLETPCDSRSHANMDKLVIS
jgi:putative nucleotidyltransferase with HDIG domain